MIVVVTERRVVDQCQNEVRYPISSRKASAVLFAQAIRGHWGIENTCHWALDMETAYRNDLANIHDAGFGHFAGGGGALLRAELRRGGRDHGLVIDLGCGCGILSELLAADGFDVLGIDLSAAFIEAARQRVPRGCFRVESLLTAELPPCVAVAIVGEGLNYLFDDRHSPEGVRQVLARAFAALAPGGLLIFDVSEPGRVPGPGPAKVHVEGDGWAVLVTITEEPEQGLLTRHITSFRALRHSC